MLDPKATETSLQCKGPIVKGKTARFWNLKEKNSMKNDHHIASTQTPSEEKELGLYPSSLFLRIRQDGETV